MRAVAYRGVPGNPPQARRSERHARFLLSNPRCAILEV